MIHIDLFGKLQVSGSEGRSIAISGAKTQGLIAYLALNTELPPSRDRLMALFWGDRFTEQARQSLRQAISKLRRVFSPEGGDVILVEDDRVGLNPAKVVVDVDRFALLARDPSAEKAIEAVSLLKGPLLDGLFGQQAEFDDWIASERQRVATQAGKIFERAAKEHVRSGRVSEAIATARKLIALDPLRDASQIILIRILAQSGERAAAIQQFNAYNETLQRELGVGAGPDLMKLMTEIRSETFARVVEVPEAQPDDAPAPVPESKPRENERVRIAVVPFATLAPGAEQEMFVEGLSQDITTNLSRFRWLDVHASLSLEGPRLTAADMAQLGKELGLNYVVHGSLRTHGKNLRLTVQLADPASGRYQWVERYDRVTDDIFDVQDELSDTIAASIEAELERAAGNEARLQDTEDMSAWDNYHRGLAIQYEFSAKTNAEAQKFFRRAIEMDPNFAAAYGRLAYALVISAIYFEAENVPELLDEALALARKSCQLDHDDAVGRFALGRVYLARGEYDRSLTELKTAINLNPGMAQAHCGLGDSLAYSGHLDEAMDCFNEAVRLSPSDPYRWAFLSYGATALLFDREFEKAADWAAQAESVPNAHYWATAIRTSALGHLGEFERATSALAELKEKRPGITCDWVRERLFYLRDPDQVEIYVEGLRKAGLK